MRKYFIRTPGWLKTLFPACVWKISTKQKTLYLTFDDGPSDETEFVLEQLRLYNAKATFFCIGANVSQKQKMFERISQENHVVGNHTWRHLDGWKTSREDYFADVEKTSGVVPGNLFRPPYGRITPAQVKLLSGKGYKIIMWSIISGDFDQEISPEACYQNVMNNIHPGAIIVFHDSLKAAANMMYALPRVLKECSAAGYTFEALTNSVLDAHKQYKKNTKQ